MIDFNNPEISFAIQAVRRASQLVKLVQDELVASPAARGTLTKDDRSPVTVADFASQALVASLLAEAFPDDALVGEEDSAALRAAPATLQQVTSYVGRSLPGATREELVSQPRRSRDGAATPDQVCAWIDRGSAESARRFWTLDPIDGTKGFLRRDQYAVALALVVEGKVQVGVLGCPRLSEAHQPDYAGPGSLVVAASGQGTWWASLHEEKGTYERLHVSTNADPTRARLLRSFESGHTNVGKIDQFIQLLEIRGEAVRMDSQAKYAVLAAGQGELLVRLLSPSQPDYREKIWDQAAGSLVLEEAGGVITDLDGKPLDFTSGRMLVHNRGVLASNGVLHPAAVRALRQLGV